MKAEVHIYCEDAGSLPIFGKSNYCQYAGSDVAFSAIYDSTLVRPIDFVGNKLWRSLLACRYGIDVKFKTVGQTPDLERKLTYGKNGQDLKIVPNGWDDKFKSVGVAESATSLVVKRFRQGDLQCGDVGWGNADFVLKHRHGSCGRGVRIIHDVGELHALGADAMPSYYLEGFINGVVSFYSVNTFISDDGFDQMYLMSQIIRGFRYAGANNIPRDSRFPANNILAASRTIFSKYFLDGGRGGIGIDFAVDSSRRIHCIEVNTRCTATLRALFFLKSVIPAGFFHKICNGQIPFSYMQIALQRGNDFRKIIESANCNRNFRHYRAGVVSPCQSLIIVDADSYFETGIFGIIIFGGERGLHDELIEKMPSIWTEAEFDNALRR